MDVNRSFALLRMTLLDDDILSGIYTGKWDKATADKAKKAAKTALLKFKGGISVKGITAKVNKTSRDEYTRSDYSEALRKHDPDAYADKLRAASVADDVVIAATNWSRDGGLTHPRKDDFVDFDRGQTLIMSGTNQYSAVVIVGITDKGEFVFYDVEDMKPTAFDIKSERDLPAVTPDEPFDAMLKVSNDVIITDPQQEINPSEQNSSEKVSTSGKPQFSLPAKSQSAGARAKSNANRSRSKTFTREDAALIAEAVTEDATRTDAEEGYNGDNCYSNPMIAAYKSSESYKINALLREGIQLDEEQDAFISLLDDELLNCPKYNGTTYRNISFAMEGKDSFDLFLSEHEEGGYVSYPAYTSTSKSKDGYPVSGDYSIHFEIVGKSGHDISKLHGLQEEEEVIYQRNTEFRIVQVRLLEKEAYIKLEEVSNHGKENDLRTGNGYSQQNTGNGSGSNSSGDSSTMQSLHISEVRKAKRKSDGGVQGVSEWNSERDFRWEIRSQESVSGRQWDTIHSEELEKTQFSLPSKSKGGEAKERASRNRSKTYTRADAEAIVDAMLSDSTVFGYGEYVGTLKGKGKLVDALWVKLNSSDEKERKKHAFKLADAVIDSMVLDLSVDDPVMALYVNRVGALRKYLHQIDLSALKDEIKSAGNVLPLYSRWQKKDGGGMPLDRIKAELEENGIVIDADGHADILFEMDRLYTETLQGIKNNSDLILAQIMEKSELDAYRNDLARRFLEESEARGSASKLSRDYYEQFLRLSEEYARATEQNERDLKKAIADNDEKARKDAEKRKEQLERTREKYDEWRATLREKTDAFKREMREKLADERAEHRLTREIAFRAEQFKKLKFGKMHAASGFNPKMFRQAVGILGGVVRGGKVSEKKAREISAKLSEWLKDHEARIKRDGADEDGRSFHLKTLIEFLEDIADSSLIGKNLTVSELKNLSYVMARLTAYVRDYGKIIRGGRMVDALPVVEGYIDRSKRTRKISRGPLRALREWYLGKFADPATVMRYADGYDEHGFFTETFNEFREGAITVEITRMDLMQSYAEFFEEHKKYEYRLAEYVEFRGRKIPRNVLISLWMTTKRKQAQLGLAIEGAQYRAEPDTKEAKKTDDGTRVFDIPPFGDPTRDIRQYPYTQTELDEMMKKIRAEVEKSLNDTDRAYIAMVEGIFSECGKIKRDVDMKRYGDTNVDESQYYFPIARADVAQTIEQESWQQGLDRVSHLSMNKDTVKGAHNRLYLGGVDAILMRHVNQVSLYNGIATAVDNFNLIVNLNTVDTGAAITVNNTVTRTDNGKAALDYIKKLKNDIERVNRVELDDAGVTKFLSYLRSAYATSTLGANPKVWATQLSSFIAATNVLDADSIAKGLTLPMGKVPKTSVARSATKIVAGMSAAERARVLQGKSIQPHPIRIADGFDVDWDALEKNQWGKIRAPLIKRMRELGFLKTYSTDSISVTFDFSGEGLRKSMNSQVNEYGGNLSDLAKVVMNLQPLLDNAVLIEVHPDKAKETPKENAQLLQTYVLLSAYAEGNTVTPVQFEVKQYVDDQNRLYLAVALTKIETGVFSDTAPRSEERTRLIPVSDHGIAQDGTNVNPKEKKRQASSGDTILDQRQASTLLIPISDISIPRLIENINPSDENFFKYIPDSMLTDAQRGAKRRALEKEAKKYGRDLSEPMEEEQASTEDEVDVYCPLAKHRNATNTAYEAQSVSARTISKVNDLLMKPIGAVDRFVIERLWGACQVQIEKDGGAKVGTEENKQAAGKLLQKVILETQQNSLATERSSAMRSQNEIMKSLTMFSADAMKMIGRFFDAYGEAYVIRARLKDPTLTAEERQTLEARGKIVDKQVARSIAVLLSSAVFMALLAAGFKAFLGQYEEKEPEEVTLDITADGVGNLFSGLPLVRDVYSYFADGFELNMHLLTPVNGLLDATKALTTLAADGASGRGVSSQDIANALRKGFYAGGQILGLPAKNIYKYATGLTKRIFPDAGYAIDAFFTHKPYAADLKKAIEADDPRMIAMIASLATGENYGIYSETTRTELQKLVAAGYTVFPRTVGDTVAVDGETVELTGAQKTRFEKVYRISDQAVEELVSLKQFKEATEKERATALKYIYDTYYSVAIDDLLGTDTEEKRVLFAEILDIEKLAMILAHVSTLTADKDKNGKTVSGSRKQKITAYVSRLNLTAAEKYAVMGYLGYTNTNGKPQVSSMINRTKLSRAEKEKLLSYCGYAESA